MNTKTLDPFRKLYMAEKGISSRAREYFQLQTSLTSCISHPYDSPKPIEDEAIPYHDSDGLLRYLGIDLERAATNCSELRELSKLLKLVLEAGLKPVRLEYSYLNNKTRIYARFDGETDRFELHARITDEVYTPTVEPFAYVLHRELDRHLNRYHAPDHRDNYTIEQWVPHPVSKFVALATVSNGTISYNVDAPVENIAKLSDEVEALLKKCNYRPIGSSRKRTARREVHGVIYGCYVESKGETLRQFTVER